MMSIDIQKQIKELKLSRAAGVDRFVYSRLEESMFCGSFLVGLYSFLRVCWEVFGLALEKGLKWGLYLLIHSFVDSLIC